MSSYISSVFGRIVFELYDSGQMFGFSFHKLVDSLQEFWPVPPDRTRVTQSGL